MNHKSVIIFLVLVVIALYQQATALIIFINGTGSAGKTSVAKELDMLLPGVYQKVTLDEIIWQQLIVTARAQQLLSADISDVHAKTLLEAFDRATMDNLWVAAKIDSRLLYKKVREKSLAGINVLVDTVMKNEDEINACMQELQGLEVCFVLVYCPLTHLPQHVCERNSSGTQGEKRLLRWAVQEFVSMYHGYNQESEQCIDSITQQQINDAIDLVREEFVAIACNEKRSLCLQSITQADAWCERAQKEFGERFACDSTGRCHIAPVLTYDCVVNTSIYTPAQCANQIVDHIHGRG